MLKAGAKYEQLEEGGDPAVDDDDEAPRRTYFEVELGGNGDAVGHHHLNNEVDLAPPDKGNLCYLAFFSLGTGVLFPWNAFITAVDYFQYLYPAQHVDRVFCVVYQIPNLAVLGVLLVHNLNLSMNSRIYLGFVLFLFCLSSVPAIDVGMIGGESVGTDTTWKFTVALVAIAGLADGIAQGSVFGKATLLPAKYTQALVSGTSVSGVVISTLRVFTKALISQDEAGLRKSTYLYFGLALSFCVFCIFVHAALPRLPVYRHYVKAGAVDGDQGNDKEMARLTEKGNEEDEGEEDPPASISSIFGKTWHLGMALFLTYTVTLSIFPGFLAEDVSSETLGDWYAIILILGWNIMDLAGKSFPILESFRLRRPRLLFALSLLRCVFYGLYMLATSGPAVLKGEPLGPIYVSVITACLGFSNGWLSANCLMEAPSKVSHKDAEKTEMLMVWFLLLGLTVGALLGWLWVL